MLLEFRKFEHILHVEFVDFNIFVLGVPTVIIIFFFRIFFDMISNLIHQINRMEKCVEKTKFDFLFVSIIIEELHADVLKIGVIHTNPETQNVENDFHIQFICFIP